MFSIKNMLSTATWLFYDDVFAEEDVIAIVREKNRKNPTIPYWNYGRIEETLDDMSDAELKAEFRFGRGELGLLTEVLQIPESFTCSNGTVSSGFEALLMFLKRFSYPCRLSDMVPRFGRSIPEMSLILAEVTDFIVTTHGHLLSDLNQPWLRPAELELFAQAIHRKGAALDNCWAFVDGTVRPICRPGEQQRVMYNGHKRLHGLKFQSVVAPNGLIANLFGPVGESTFFLIIKKFYCKSWSMENCCCSVSPYGLQSINQSFLFKRTTGINFLYCLTCVLYCIFTVI